MKMGESRGWKRRILCIALSIAVTAGSFGMTGICAAAAPSVSSAKDNVQSINKQTQYYPAYLRKDITVEFNRERLEFRDEKGRTVYPLTYNGSTYLPVRAVSGLMGEPIEWDNRAKTVYIGKTLSRPVKYLTEPGDSPYVQVVSGGAVGAMKSIVVRVQREVLVMYDFETLTMRDEAGTQIYAVNYNGSNYLPLRAAAALMKEDIEWDGKTRTVYIGSKTPIEEPEKEEVREETQAIIALYDKEAELYNLATERIAKVAKWTPEEAPILAAAVSADLRTAGQYKGEAKELLRTDSLTDEEQQACQKLYDFVEITEYYILMMENIAYMAADGQDYSVLAETFLNFALQTDRAMDDAREAIECLQEQ